MMKNNGNVRSVSLPERCIDTVSRFFSGAAFPAFVITGGSLYLAFLAVVVFWPSGQGAWGGFVTDFRIWCFDYDPGTGAMRWSWAWIMMTQPLILLAVALGFWWWPLAEAWRQRKRRLLVPASSGAAVAALLSAGMVVMATGEVQAENPPFPADRMRTELTFPDFALHNQEGEPVRLSDFEGEVVLLTAMYSTCGTACPMLAVQAKRAVEKLPAGLRDLVTIAAVSLDPENDTAASMSAAAEAYGLAAPGFQFLNGDPEKVNRLLDHLQVARIPNETTGEIEHANLYFLIDRAGRIAYRLNLSQRHEDWLVEGLRVLAEEAAGQPNTDRDSGSAVTGAL